VAKRVELYCEQYSSGLTFNKVLSSLRNYSVLYNNSEIDLWINGVIYRFGIKIYPSEIYSCYY